MTPSKRCELRSLPGAAAAAFGAALILAPPAAQAEPPGDPMIAEALFKAARSLIEAGDYAAGCPKFEASFALRASASTMLNIARCHEHDGKTASAWEDYRRALALNEETHGEERKKLLQTVATRGIESLEPRLARLRIVVTNPTAGLRVMRDGRELPAATLGAAVPADPGQHEISVSAPGYRSETRSTVLEESKTVTVDVSLQLVMSVDGPSAPALAGVPATPAVGPSPRRIAAYATGSIGVASLLVGGALTGLMLAKKGVANQRCDPTGLCDHEGKLAADSAKQLWIGGAIGVGAGIAGLGAATVLWLTDPERSRARPAARRGAWVSADVVSADERGVVLGVRGGF